jgi:hypothetical protein
MIQQSKLLFILGLSALCSGCVGTGPNTQQGAVAGGAIGALTGAIIGNNSGGRNGLAGALIGGTVGAIAGGTIGNSIDNERGTLYHSEGEATTTVVVQQPPPLPPPPAPPQEIPPGPPGGIWINGYYSFDPGHGVYVWTPGHWIVPPPGYYSYVAPHWAWRGGTYVYIRGYWR